MLAARMMRPTAALMTARAVAGSGLRFHTFTVVNGKVVPFVLSDIGEGIAEVEILKWFVKPGDRVAQFDPIVEVQSDKAMTEITSRFDGVIKKVYFDKGAMAPTGSTLVDIEQDDDAGAAASHDAHPKAAEAASAPAAGGGAAAGGSTAAAAGSKKLDETGKVFATPAVRRLAREHDIDLHQVHGSGKDGRVMKSDVLSFIAGGAPAPAAQPAVATAPAATAAAAPSKPAAPAATAAPAAAGVSRARADVVVPVRGLMRTMVKTMTAAWQVPHFGYCDEYRMDAVMELRTQLKPAADAQGLKFSYMPIIMKAVALSLASHPSLNATVNAEITEVTQHGSVNLGLAVDTPNGLIVPNIKNVQDLSMFEIARELNRLVALAAEGKLKEADLKGGTFTLSNIGAIGGTYASPVLMLPQVAIGALGKTQKLPRYDAAGNLVPMNIMNVSWAADHRVVDGATMARFSNQLRSYLENPSSMLAHLH